MKIIWHSNGPWNTTGYGEQTALFVPRIASLGHEIVMAAPYTFGGSPLDWNGFPVLPSVRDSAGCDVIAPNYEYHGADLLFTLCDPFGLQKATGTLEQINVAHWFPVDCNPLGDGDVTVLRDGGGIPIAMSQFGAQVLRSEGADPLYVPHAVDTKVFCPGDQAPFRETVPGIGEDTFVIGICAMNRDPVRKGFSEQLLAFSRFHSRHPDSFLALHTAPVNNPGINLKSLVEKLGIGAATTFPDSYAYDMGMITREQMAAWYRGLDILSCCSYGEGFGLPLIEAQACGTPVVTTDASAMTELCGAGWLVSGTPYWSAGHNAWWKRPDVDDIEQSYEMAYQARQDGILPRKQAFDFAQLYDVDRVFAQYMIPALEEIAERIEYGEPAAEESA